MKRVISLWLPNFATDRLCRLRQDWLDSPLGLVRENGGQQVLHAVNDMAQNSGIRAGMTFADARAILPELQTSEADLAAEITARTGAISLAGQTSFADVASLSRTAAAAIGNDTGPMHIAAICGCPSVVLFSKDSDPSITAPRGNDVTVLQRDNLADLPVSEVADALRLR